MLPDFPQLAGRRTVVIGIGNLLNGDDGAGIFAARVLKEALMQRGVQTDAPFDSPGPAVWIIDSGPAPESFTGPVRRFLPDIVVLIDAAELDEAPGTVRWFDWQAAQGMSGSTHTLPPSLLARYLMAETRCRVILIGIQPKQLEFDAGLSEEVRWAAGDLANFLTGRLG